MPELCQNPFFPCTSPEPTKIVLDVIYKGQRLPICKACWDKLAESDAEWSKEPTQTIHK